MTYKTAADMIDRILDEDWHVYSSDAITALGLARDALLKLEPTPPVKVKDQVSVLSPLLEKYVCPTCGEPVYDHELIDNCPVCGQRLTPYYKVIGDKDDD